MQKIITGKIDVRITLDIIIILLCRLRENRIHDILQQRIVNRCGRLLVLHDQKREVVDPVPEDVVSHAQRVLAHQHIDVGIVD